MDNFTFYSPTFFVFGKGTQHEAGQYVSRFGGTKVLIHYGGGSAQRSGLLDAVKQSLQKEGIAFCELGGVQPNPRSGLVYEGIELARKEKADFVLAVGGGSVIDSAKAIAAGAVYDGDFWDYYQGRVVEKSLKVATILTISAAGSEGSGDSVVTHEDGMFKRATTGHCLRPVFSILNPELLQTLPPYQTACGVTDIMAHVFERYLTNNADVEITDRLCESILLTMIKEGPKAVADASDYQSRANIMWAGMVAHNNVCGVGRSHDWASHDLEHELSSQYDVAHGAGLAVVMPAVMKYNVNHNPLRFAQMAVRVWGCQMNFENPLATALEGIACFKSFLSSIGMPVSFAEMGAKEEDIPAMAEKCCYGDGRTGNVGGFVSLGQKDVENIYRSVLT